jgi:flagellar motor switch protein FliG
MSGAGEQRDGPPAGAGGPERAAQGAAAEGLTRRHKAAIVIGVLGPDAAGPILEQLEEAELRGFAEAMAQLDRVEPEAVEATIAEFLSELETAELTLRGGLETARGVLQRHLDENAVVRLLDEADSPSLHNVWKKLARVNDEALAEFLKREHPQTAAVVLSKLPSDFAAQILSRFEPERARDIVLGITRAQTLDAKVIEAIGDSVSRDFLAAHGTDGLRRDPAERVGAIMNFTATAVRNHVLDQIAETQPDFAEEIKRKMFTFEDIPERLDPRAAPAVVRAAEPDTLLNALAGAEQTAPEARDFLLDNISGRVAQQIRDDLSEIEKVRRKDADAAQNEIILLIRDLVERGEITLVSAEDDA